MNEYRHYCITREPARTIRAEMCTSYRNLRKVRPDMARLLWRRMKNATKIVSDAIYTSYTTGASGGLSDLLKKSS